MTTKYLRQIQKHSPELKITKSTYFDLQSQRDTHFTRLWLKHLSTRN